ncbi:helix-turn-helix domain-containing protein [Nonomuraea sp. NPDC050790]|uniref:AraC-like ligand-binding domain-containing protein n=1 Tax=Nonomuraea sp. NPDC050790 TaxID=3364371 RepID=UPI003788DC42
MGDESTTISGSHAVAWFHEAAALDSWPVRLAIEDRAAFRAELSRIVLDDVQVLRWSTGAHRAWRTPAMIRRDDPEQLALVMVSHGSMSLSLKRHHAEARAGHAFLFDTSSPFTSTTPLGGVTQTLVRLPREAIPLPADRVGALLGRPIALDRGIGFFLARFLDTLALPAAECSPYEVEHLRATVVDWVSVLLAGQVDACHRLPVMTRQQELLRRIDTFIDHNLGAHDLTPSTIAARHHISLRWLHALFARRGESVAASIRRRRLERCAQDLARCTVTPVHLIAARWGFPSATAFGRSFRAAYGSSPKDFRRQALEARPR